MGSLRKGFIERVGKCLRRAFPVLLNPEMATFIRAELENQRLHLKVWVHTRSKNLDEEYAKNVATILSPYGFEDRAGGILKYECLLMSSETTN